MLICRTGHSYFQRRIRKYTTENWWQKNDIIKRKIINENKITINSRECKQFEWPAMCSALFRLFTVGPKLNIRAVRRRTGGRRRRWVVLWPAAAARRAFFIGGGGGVGLWSAAAATAASDRMREHWNSALAVQAFFSGFTGVSHFTCDLRWAADAEKLTVNMHALHNFTVLMSCSLPNF